MVRKDWVTIPPSFSPSFPQEESNSLYIADGDSVRCLSFTHPRLHVVLICPDQNIGHIEEDYTYSDVARGQTSIAVLQWIAACSTRLGWSLITYIGLFTYTAECTVCVYLICPISNQPESVSPSRHVLPSDLSNFHHLIVDHIFLDFPC